MRITVLEYADRPNVLYQRAPAGSSRLGRPVLALGSDTPESGVMYERVTSSPNPPRSLYFYVAFSDAFLSMNGRGNLVPDHNLRFRRVEAAVFHSESSDETIRRQETSSSAEQEPAQREEWTPTSPPSEEAAVNAQPPFIPRVRRGVVLGATGARSAETSVSISGGSIFDVAVDELAGLGGTPSRWFTTTDTSFTTSTPTDEGDSN
jgi:hypothetical protein